MPLQIPAHKHKPEMVEVMLEYLLNGGRNLTGGTRMDFEPVTGMEATRIIDAISGHEPWFDAGIVMISMEERNEDVEERERAEQARRVR